MSVAPNPGSSSPSRGLWPNPLTLWKIPASPRHTARLLYVVVKGSPALSHSPGSPALSLQFLYVFPEPPPNPSCSSFTQTTLPLQTSHVSFLPAGGPELIWSLILLNSVLHLNEIFSVFFPQPPKVFIKPSPQNPIMRVPWNSPPCLTWRCRSLALQRPAPALHPQGDQRQSRNSELPLGGLRLSAGNYLPTPVLSPTSCSVPGRLARTASPFSPAQLSRAPGQG